jgi:hypothetical protein
MVKGKKVARKKGRPQSTREATIGRGGELHQTAGGASPVMTTQQGIPVSDDKNSLTVGPRGPGLLEDFHLREKLFHFDHERIPSPALSILKNGPESFAGRKVGALVTDGVDSKLLQALQKALKKEGALLKLVAPEIGGVEASDGSWHEAAEKLEGGPSVLFDAVAILPSRDGAAQLAGRPGLRFRCHGASQVHRLHRRCRPTAGRGRGRA